MVVRLIYCNQNWHKWALFVKDMFLRMLIIFMRVSALLRPIFAVSYTHLDVYKRQAQIRIALLDESLLGPFHAEAVMTRALAATGNDDSVGEAAAEHVVDQRRRRHRHAGQR